VRRIFEVGGLLAGVVLLGFGIAVIVLAIGGRSTVHDELAQQQIVGTPDMTPAAIKAEATKAGLENVALPTCSVANEPVTSGATARCFSQYMRIHALEASGGKVYAEMPQYATPNGVGTNDPTRALMHDGKPVSNPSRNVWVTETALATALNMSYMADQLALFSLVVGVALLLSGVGFLVLAAGGALRRGGPGRAA
jgi:hypothetical protein